MASRRDNSKMKRIAVDESQTRICVYCLRVEGAPITVDMTKIDPAVFCDYFYNHCERQEGKAMGSFCPSVRLSLHLFPLYLFNRLIFEIKILYSRGEACGMTRRRPAAAEPSGAR